MTREEAIDFIEQVGADLGFIDVELVVNQIYDEHEAQLKTKDEEIDRLKAIVEDAIRKPMGVEPHSWSDYKIKDKA